MRTKIQKQNKSIQRLGSDIELLLNSNEDLKLEAEIYKVNDSLNTARIKDLTLTIKEFKRYRQEDLELINKLKIRAKDLEAIVDTKIEKHDSIYIQVYDSIPNIISFDYTSKWTDVNGIIDRSKDSLQLVITNREELKVVESIKRKRFLGFLWYCKRLEYRKIDVLSMNPNTTISNISYVTVTE